ncbi:MAG: hypothetical protein FWC80_06090 [Firmicutes bacterium]|nr:hypothetical protein [Bacillota bacterium]
MPLNKMPKRESEINIYEDHPVASIIATRDSKEVVKPKTILKQRNFRIDEERSNTFDTFCKMLGQEFTQTLIELIDVAIEDNREAIEAYKAQLAKLKLV